MKPSAMDIPVHDITAPLEIQEYSFYWFAFIIAVIFMVVFVLVKQFRRKQKSQKQDERVQCYENFTHIDLSDPKSAAYAICAQGFYFAHDNEQTLRAYHTLFERLESYKYARIVEAIDEETQELYRSYQKMISVEV